MKKAIYVTASVLFCLVVAYFSYGFYLNATLEEKTLGVSQDLLIPIRKTDSMYKSGLCANVLTIYPWEDAHDTPKDMFDKKGDLNNETFVKLVAGEFKGKVECTIVSRNSFDFEYIESWKNKREIGTLFGLGLHPFAVVNNLFFNKKLSVCLDNNKPLELQKENYSTAWFSVRGFRYRINLTEEDKLEWKKIFDDMIAKDNFPKTAKLVESETCDSYTSKDVIREYPVKFVNTWI